MDWKEYWACLALRHARSVGTKTSARLLYAYGSALAAVMDVRSWKHRGLASDAHIQAMLSEAWLDKARDEWQRVRGLGCGVAVWAGQGYPFLLRRIPDPPLCLYFHGDRTLLLHPGAAMVGARKCTRYGLNAADRIGRGLSKAGITVVSGMAYGIDRQAHLAGLTGPGSSIAVLGTGLDAEYPKGNLDVRQNLEQEGLVVSEFSPGTEAHPGNFPVRNRIISGLSLGVVVVEAAKTSGALITARNAMEQGREVFAVPGPGGSPSHDGCHRLINDGAKLVGTAEDVLVEVGPLIEEDHHLDPEVWGRGGLDQPEVNETSQEEPWRLPLPLGMAWDDVIEDFVCDIPMRISEDISFQGSGPRETPPGQAAEIRNEPAEPVELSGEESEVMSTLETSDPMHIDLLGQNLGWDAGKVSRVLLVLEVRGLVRQWPGMVYGVNEPGMRA
ncbi:MAG: DNA-protecting protein DprA [Desulfovibrio sp.]|nr:MAG: DNA-protecting protein DprA [Desulfovibrio sp.]